MPLTNTTVATELARRLGPYVALVDTAGLVARGARSLGATMASPLTITDAELAAVTVAQADQLLDVAELQGLEEIVDNLDEVELRARGITEDPDRIFARLWKRIESLRGYIRQTYGIGLSSLSVGVIDLGFTEIGDADEFGCGI